jgi:hypothetical protein
MPGLGLVERLGKGWWADKQRHGQRGRDNN